MMRIVKETPQPNGLIQRIFIDTKELEPKAKVVGHEYKFNSYYYVVNVDPNKSMPRKVVCAATYLKDYDIIITSVRHYDKNMGLLIGSVLTAYKDTPIRKRTNSTLNIVQGFVCNFGGFLTREEAWELAIKNNQIIHRVGGDTIRDGTLFSENLY